MNIQDIGIKTINAVYSRLSFKDYNDTPFKSKDEIESIRTKKLCSLLKTVTKNVPFYKPYFKQFDFDRFTFDQLEILPIITKRDIVQNILSFTNHNVQFSKDYTTSGSSGSVLNFKLPILSQSYEFMSMYRHLNMSSNREHTLFEPIILLRSFSPKAGEPIYKFDKNTNLTFLSPYHINQENLETYLSVIRASRASVLKGYPSSIYIFTQLLIDNGIILPQIKTIVTSSESLLDTYRLAIEQYWGINIMDWYGQNERTVLITQSSEGIYYNNDDYGILEVKNEEMIVTSLNNHVFPFIRYNSEDTCIKNTDSENKSSLGIHFSSPIKKIIGRSDDILIKEDGTHIPTINIYTMFYKIEDISQFKITQNKDLTIDVQFVSSNRNTESDSILKIIDGLENRLGKIKISITPVKEIVRSTTTGKVKTIENLSLQKQ